MSGSASLSADLQDMAGAQAAGTHGARDSAFMKEQEMAQQVLIVQQNKALDDLSQSAQRLGHIAIAVNEQLEKDQQLLAQLDEDMDKQTEKLNFVTKRLRRLMRP